MPSNNRSVVRSTGNGISGLPTNGASVSLCRSPLSLNSTASTRQPERKASSTSRTPSTPTAPLSVGTPPRSAARNSFSQRFSRLAITPAKVPRESAVASVSLRPLRSLVIVPTAQALKSVLNLTLSYTWAPIVILAPGVSRAAPCFVPRSSPPSLRLAHTYDSFPTSGPGTLAAAPEQVRVGLLYAEILQIDGAHMDVHVLRYAAGWLNRGAVIA